MWVSPWILATLGLCFGLYLYGRRERQSAREALGRRREQHGHPGEPCGEGCDSEYELWRMREQGKPHNQGCER
jgi:hypothetical protein